MQRIFLLLSIHCLVADVTPAQEKKSIASPAKKPLSVSCDCTKPVNIKLSKFASYGLTLPPAKTGKERVISGNKKSKYYFDEEHHSAWYSFTIPFDGDFVFEIIPEQIQDDYDFLLFKYTDSIFCNELKKKKLKSVRSNISRNNQDINSITGLSMAAIEELIHEGIGAPFSKYVAVKKGERYILVLDNVYDNGRGHTIQFSYKKLIEISGTVLDDDSLPIKAEITLEDSKGNVIIKTETDEKTGKYILNPYLNESQNYSLTIYNDSGFVQSKIINTNKKENFKNIKTILPKLKGGRKYVLGNINFYGDVAKLIPSAMPSVLALYKLMKKNKHMVIRIEGHTNGCSGEQVAAQKLSENRAKTIADSLVAKGIEKARISTIGYNCKYMLYPRPKNKHEEEQNRRVEINVISIE